jgi:hypothetical protein
MDRILTTVALTFALGVSALSPALAQNSDQRGSMAGMMGGACPMIGMMGQGLNVVWRSVLASRVQFANDTLRYIEADQLRTPANRGLRRVVHA